MGRGSACEDVHQLILFFIFLTMTGHGQKMKLQLGNCMSIKSIIAEWDIRHDANVSNVWTIWNATWHDKSRVWNESWNAVSKTTIN